MSPVTQIRRLVRAPFISINKLLKQQEQSALKLLVQILIIQILFYLDFVLQWKTVAYLLGFSSSESIFLFSNFSLKDARGLSFVICWLFNSVIISFIISVIVGRSKLAWDFALTIHIVNFSLCLLVNKAFPKSITWWLVQVISSLLIIFLGTYMSRFRELRDTFFDELIDSGNNNTVEMNDLEAQK